MSSQRSARSTGKSPDPSSLEPTLQKGNRSNPSPGFSLAPEAPRPTGIDAIGAVPWGTHFCQFYATPQDLIDILVPYFRAGLEANEFCMWVTSLPLQADEALAALQTAVPNLEEYRAKGQIEVLDYSECYIRGGHFDADAVLQGWTDKLAGARSRGFSGLRLTGNTFWLEDALWEDFTRYEARINELTGSQRMIVLCTYNLEKCGAREIMDIVANHQFTLIKSKGRWETIESSAHKTMVEALRESEARYRNLFEGMTEGFGLHEIICDEAGNPCDFRFLDINPAFEKLTGLKRENVVGKTLNQVLPGDDPKWVEMYGKVALTGESVHFENYSPGLNRYYRVFAYRPAPRQFAVIFIDVTEQKRAEKVVLENLAQIEVHHRLLEQREQERLQIARDLHDGPVQELAGVTIAIQLMLMEGKSQELEAQLQEIQASVSKQIKELRAYAGELRPPTLARFGLVKAIESHRMTFMEKYPGLEVSLEEDWGDLMLPEQTNLAFFRIYQESLTNTTKHSQASRVAVRLIKTEDHQAIMEIQDNGAGFRVPADWMELVRRGHLGLVGMSERAEAIGGRMEVKSQPGKGTQVRVVVPLNRPAEMQGS